MRTSIVTMLAGLRDRLRSDVRLALLGLCPLVLVCVLEPSVGAAQAQPKAPPPPAKNEAGPDAKEGVKVRRREARQAAAAAAATRAPSGKAVVDSNGVMRSLAPLPGQAPATRKVLKDPKSTQPRADEKLVTR